MMKTLKNTFLFVLLILTLASSNSVLSASTGDDKELKANLDLVSAILLVSAVPTTRPCKVASSWRWGAENKCPKTVVGALEIIVDGKSAFVPVSAFIDLGSPRSVQIESRNESGQFSVVIIGGDAATSYKATLEFRKNILEERIVRHGEFPNDAYEKTIYKFNIFN